MTTWQDQYAERMGGVNSSIIRELLKLTQIPGLISFAGGLPAPEIFPTEICATATTRLLKEQGQTALQYSATEGYAPLRQLIVDRLGKMGIQLTIDNVQITSGSQQGLDLIGKMMLDPHDVVLTEQPTYLGALQAWKAYQANFVTVAVDDDGIDVDAMEEVLQKSNPKFMYILPNFQNPAGVTLSLERRKKLVALANRYGVAIVEDDPYGDLRYEGENLPPLMALDQELQAEGDGNVLYLGTFSKIFAPGLRLGWVAGPTAVIQKFTLAKQGADLHTSTFTQMLLHEITKDGFLDEHRKLILRVYKERRDIMLDGLKKHMPDGVTWTHPHGGLFLWVTLPVEMQARDVFDRALENKVAFVPGTAFFPESQTDYTGHNTMRLNFSNATPEQIAIGIERLGQAVRSS